MVLCSLTDIVAQCRSEMTSLGWEGNGLYPLLPIPHATFHRFYNPCVQCMRLKTRELSIRSKVRGLHDL